MSARFKENARRLALCATVLVMAGCAAKPGGRVARNATDCPMSFTLSCDAKRYGAETVTANCRCVRHKDIDALLDRQ